MEGIISLLPRLEINTIPEIRSKLFLCILKRKKEWKERNRVREIFNYPQTDRYLERLCISSRQKLKSFR